MDLNQKDATGDLQPKLESIKEEVSVFAETAKAKLGEVAEPIKEKAAEVAEKQKDAGAEQIKIAAKAVHGAASQLESEMPQIAGYIHEAGQRLERAAEDLRQGNVDELMSKFGDYARNQPAMVFGGAMLAGFALTRFVKSAAHQARPNDGKAPSAQSWNPSGYPAQGGNA
jgi:hypothetical protein